MPTQRTRGITATVAGLQKLREVKASGGKDGTRLTFEGIADRISRNAQTSVDTSTVRRFFNGKGMDRDSILAICRALGLEVTEIVDPNEWHPVRSRQTSQPVATSVILNTFLENINSESLSMLQLQTYFTESINELGFKFWTYIQLDKNNHLQSQVREIVSNYPNYWVEHYSNKDYQSVDPVINQAVNEAQAWRSSTVLQKSINSEQKELFRDAQEVGIYMGCSIPVTSISDRTNRSQFVTLVKEKEVSNWEQDFLYVSNTLTSLAYKFYSKMYQIKNREFDDF
ncbi:autoinducer binding domain-containing protein [Crocosphaera sp. XPORK-15E]|uniref:autoinducer binding domain-containing protein n=1 Tax=Crocosphaera sp. XPORK-15E TaxID=3110247 RepID=UPI002B221247|nr:autoinducer binding domain-containing protein [Crocosphaera sp. XPORK-15E]MEA5534487.1 autoinducer binding domain-containing protein [Crocosphaera sp. XPORK-15E]